MANPWGDDGDFFWEESKPGEYKAAEAKKDALIILIDCRVGMFEKNLNGEVHFCNAINVATHVLKNKVIASPNDLVGVFFYGTRETKNPNEFPGIFELQDLEPPSAQRIKELEVYCTS